MDEALNKVELPKLSDYMPQDLSFSSLFSGAEKVSYSIHDTRCGPLFIRVVDTLSIALFYL